MESLYGLGGTMYPPTEDQQMLLTQEEIAKFRRFLSLQESGEAGRKEFDLAKPPVPAYQFREFPFVMYNHRTRQTKPARNHQEREEMTAQGWSVEPFENPQERAEILSPAEYGEARKMDALLKMSPEKLERLLALAESGETQPAEPEPDNAPKRRTK